MTETEDQIRSILSDGEAMKKVMDMARSIMASGAVSEPTPPPEQTTQRPPDAGSSLPGGLSSILPEIMNMISGDSSGLDRRKLDLINALRPYMAGRSAESIDRAIKMAGTAKAAKSILGMTHKK